MQDVSRHSTDTRRFAQRPLVEPIPGYVPQRVAFAAAGLPSLAGDDFTLPALPRFEPVRIARPTKPAAKPASRRAPARVSPARFALALGGGSTLGMALGSLICTLLA